MKTSTVFKLPFDNYCETSNWFYFLSNALCYIQIKFRDHKLISLGTKVENIHPKIKKKSTKFYILSSLLRRHKK